MTPYSMLFGQKNLNCEKNLKKFNFNAFRGSYDQIASSPQLYAIWRKKMEMLKEPYAIWRKNPKPEKNL